LKHQIKKDDDNKKNVNIRMVSGDHVNTAMAVAYEAGILDKDLSTEDLNEAVMTGDTFKASLGGY